MGEFFRLKKVNMKNTLIIVGSLGIGLSLIDKLSGQDYKVYVTYNENKIEVLNSNVQYHQLDVMHEQLDLSFLPDQLDNMAYCSSSINLMPFQRIKPKSFLEDYQLQVVGVVNVLQKAVPFLKKSNIASVLFFSTVAIQTGFNFHTQVTASKRASEDLTRSLATEWTPKIRVNTIALSITDILLASKLLSSDEKINADRHPLKKIGTSEDIANAAEFLLSEKSSWITGQNLTVDGRVSSLKT